MKNDIIGIKIKYFDYLDSERYGTIIAVEPYKSIDSGILYCYIQDEDPDFNLYTDTVNGTAVTYAEIRLSTEVYPIE